MTPSLTHPTDSSASPAGDALAYFGAVRLASWPDLLALPADAVPLFARLCALVDRRPTTASLIPLILGASKEAVFQALEHLRAQGHLQWSRALGAGAAAPGAAPAEAPQSEAPTESLRPAEHSFVGKLWGWLARRTA